jgi:hypothetical protein
LGVKDAADWENQFCAKGAQRGSDFAQLVRGLSWDYGGKYGVALMARLLHKLIQQHRVASVRLCLLTQPLTLVGEHISMKKLNQMLAVAGVALALGLSTGHVAAQGRGNFDPAQFKQRMMDRYKERLEVTSDAEWKIIEERIDKVMTAQREARIGGFGGFGGGGRRGGGNNGGTDAAAGGGGNRPNPFAADNANVDALQKAVDGKASSDELKGKMAKLRDSLKEKEATLSKAQDDLRKVLSVRQEAIAVLAGLLK